MRLIEQYALAAVLRLIVFIRILCEWWEPRMVFRLKQLADTA